MCKEEKKIESEIILNIRGGKPVSLPFKAETIIPKVVVLEEEFNFGGVTTLGNSSNLKMTLVNNSDIAATLLLDLREKVLHINFKFSKYFFFTLKRRMAR